MKRQRARILILGICTLLLWTATLLAGTRSLNEPTTFADAKFEIHDLQAIVEGNDDVMLISGKIKNLSFTTVKGYVIVYLQDKDEAVIFATEADVNERQPFPHGKSGFFETAINIGDTPAVENVSIEFVDQR